MIHEKLRSYGKNKKELIAIDKMIDKLENRLSSVPEVSVKVQKSSDDFPYTEGHLTVKAHEPKEATRIKDRIREKEKRRSVLKADIQEVETFIDCMPDGIEKQIFEMVYYDQMTQKEVGEAVGYTQSMVSKVVKSQLKDS